jgi:hypothetical protein
MAVKDKEPVKQSMGEGADADEQIRLRAYEISQSPDSGTPEENWHRAERELEQRNDTAT